MSVMQNTIIVAILRQRSSSLKLSVSSPLQFFLYDKSVIGIIILRICAKGWIEQGRRLSDPS